MQEYSKVLELVNQPVVFSGRAKRDMKHAHFTEEMLLEILKNPKIVQLDEKGFVIRGRKTAKIGLRVIDDKTLFIESFSYNQVSFVF